jgi:hypothetical protein
MILLRVRYLPGGLGAVGVAGTDLNFVKHAPDRSSGRSPLATAPRIIP